MLAVEIQTTVPIAISTSRDDLAVIVKDTNLHDMVNIEVNKEFLL